MKEFSVRNLAQIINAESVDTDVCITGVSIDSRTIGSGDCFFAVPGENFDGHNYVEQAFVKEAACAVVKKDFAGKAPRGRFLLRVDDTVKALGSFAREYRRFCNFKVIAITGSAGKTTTRHIVYHALSRRFRTTTAPKNYNNNIGLPLTLLSAGPEDEIVVTELGTNHPGEIAVLTRIAEPDVALVTNVHPCHLEYLRNLDTIVREKISIAEALRPDGTFFINSDFSQLLEACIKRNIPFKTFGTSEPAELRADDINYTKYGSSFKIGETVIRLPLPGAGNLENALAAWALCSSLGLDIDDFTCSLKTFRPVSMRTEIIQSGTVTIINDCYNANPASMKNALQILAKLSESKSCRSVFICGGMAELGTASEEFHIGLADEISDAGVDALIAVGPLAEITAGAAADNNSLAVQIFPDTLEACNKLLKFVKDYDIVLVKGSRLAKLETIVVKLKELFDRDGEVQPVAEMQNQNDISLA